MYICFYEPGVEINLDLNFKKTGVPVQVKKVYGFLYSMWDPALIADSAAFFNVAGR